jgi:phosphomannomutase / phosphoglucomutase
VNSNKLNVAQVDSAALGGAEPVYHIPPHIPRDIFRAYDIRGPVNPQHLTPDLAYAIGLAIGAEALERQEHTVIVGRDGRLSGPLLHHALCAGLLASGIHITDIGVTPTPLMYYATFRFAVASGVMVTASHNPGDHNGFKIVLQGKTLTTEDIAGIYERIVERRFVYAAVAGQKSTLACIIDDYIHYIHERIVLQRPLKIVVDCGNGVPGLVAPALYRALGCEVVELYCEVDGRFPNHHPDPLVPENLTALIERVRLEKADLGLAFDGDGDRLGVVTDQGEIIWPDRQMMLFSQDVLAKNPGATIIFDVKCSRFLPVIIEQAGGRPLMWRTGHSIIKNKMLAIGATLAGEMSGHIFFKDDWFGFDDGLYVGVRLLQILSRQNLSAAQVFAALPNSLNTPELKIAMDEDKKAGFMAQLLQSADFGAAAQKITIDGLRVNFPYGWGLVRPSNTSPCLTLRFEADTPADLETIKALFRQQLLAIEKDLVLPF